MKVYKVTVMVVDYDGLGENGVKSQLESTRYTNHCILPRVIDVTAKDIGEWEDSNPLNLRSTRDAAFDLLFCRVLDLKHHISSAGKLTKTGNGVEIHADEPTILLRGRDNLALYMLHAYRALCIEDGCDATHIGLLDELIARFRTYADTHPELMKQPDITKGA